MRRGKTAVTGLAGLVAVALTATIALAIGLQAPQAGGVRLENEFMDWADVVEEAAKFVWSVDVTNTTGQPIRVRLILDLIDDDDRPVNRDAQGNPNDTYTITIAAGETTAVRRDGSIGYDRAAEVISYRIRREIITGGR